MDVGANRGEFTFLMAKQAGNLGRIYAFELHPDNMQLLRSNLWRYRHRVRAENLAVSDGKTELVEVFAGRHASGAEWNIVGHDTDSHNNRPVFSVKAISLDRYFPSDQKLNLVKIDVEGAADKVLAGMTRLLHTSRPVIVLEIHNDAEWEGCTQLTKINYRICDLNGERLAGPRSFVFHCIAMPTEEHFT